MKKIFLTAAAIIALPLAAFAGETRIGFSAALSNFDISGTETTKSSGQKNSKDHTEFTVVPGLFIERANDAGFTFGFEFVPGEADLGSGSNARTDTDTDDAADTAGTNKVSAEVSGHMTAYVLVPAKSGFVRFGLIQADVDTTETLATGTKYGNASVNGMIFGVGYDKENDNGSFLRVEGTYTNYDDLTLQGSLDSDSVRNKVDADIDALALKLSVGKSF